MKELEIRSRVFPDVRFSYHGPADLLAYSSTAASSMGSSMGAIGGEMNVGKIFVLSSS